MGAPGTEAFQYNPQAGVDFFLRRAKSRHLTDEHALLLGQGVADNLPA
jgi:hypothetical protein